MFIYIMGFLAFNIMGLTELEKSLSLKSWGLTAKSLKPATLKQDDTLDKPILVTEESVNLKKPTQHIPEVRSGASGPVQSYLLRTGFFTVRTVKCGTPPSGSGTSCISIGPVIAVQ